MTNDLSERLSKHGFVPYPDSIRNVDDGRIFIARRGPEKLIGVEQTTRTPGLDSTILQDGDISLHTLTWENYRKLKDVLPISPSTCDTDASFGTGDRLGLSTAAHIEAFSRYPVFPVLAQQSPRELIKTDRSFRDVLLSAVMGLLESGDTKPFGADADHIKDEEFLLSAARAGYSMYTLDVSDWLQDSAHSSIDELSPLSRSIVDERAGMRVSDGYTVSRDELLTSALIYEKSMEQVKRFHELIRREVADFDLEVSIDEGARDTTVEDHLFVAEYLHRSDVDFWSLAPKFPGQFQKGVDYEGDIDTLGESLGLHAALCRQMGGYRLSLHSGSDKFSIYRLFADITGGTFHIKTSGTSWLQAVKVATATNLPLFRELYSLCLDHLDESKKAYQVKITHEDFPAELPSDIMAFFDRPDGRQLFHISYGALLDERGDAIFDTLALHEEEHYAFVSRHITEHLKLLF